MQKINIGSNPNSGDGDKLRDGFIKVNSNTDYISATFSDLYYKVGNLSGAIFGGSIVPTSPTSSIVGAAYWNAVQPGTYSNYGNVVVGTNSFAVISRGGTSSVYTISQTPFSLSGYATINSPVFTGTPSVPTAATGSTTSQIANVAFVANSLAGYVGINSPAFTGTPSVPTAATGSTTSQIANTAFVVREITTNNKSILLPDYITNVNLFKLKNIQVDKYVQTTTATIISGTSATGWECSDFISVTPGTYSLSASVKTRTGVGFYNSAKAPVRYAGIITGPVVVNSGEAYVVFNLKGPGATYSNVQFELGSSATTYVNGDINIVKKENVEGLVPLITHVNVNEDKLDELYNLFVVETTNLFNPNTTVLGVVNEITGIISTASTNSFYNTSDYISVTASELYSFMNINSSYLARKVAFFNDSLDVVAGGINGYVPNATVPIGATKMRISVANETHTSAPSINVNHMDGYGVFVGSSPVWEPWFEPKIEIPGSDIEEKGQISYTYTSGAINVTNDFGSLAGRVINSKGYNVNNMFQVVASNQGVVTVGGNDDVAPIHIYDWTMGANHAWGCDYATITAHPFTNVDIGTEFIQGIKKFYIMRIVDANTVCFLSENYGSGTSTAPNFQNLLTGTITRSAINYTITAISPEQLYPSIGELTQKVVSNGIDVVTDVSELTKTDKLEVIERYVIYDPTSVLNATIARAGTSDAPTFIGNPVVGINNIYRFTKEKALLVFANHQFYQDATFQNIMCAQAICIGGNDGTTQYYVPNSNPLNGTIDLRTPTAIAWSTSIPSTFVVNSAMPNPSIPPNRVIQYRGNTGFMMAYILTRGTGAQISSYTDRTFEIRNNTGKVYPHPIEGTKVGLTASTNSIYSTAMARVYTNLTETRVGNRLSMFEFSVDDEKHIYLDYSGSMLDTVVLNDNNLNGKKITVLESTNAILMTPNYNNNLVVRSTYISGQTSYIVLMIK